MRNVRQQTQAPGDQFVDVPRAPVRGDPRSGSADKVFELFRL
ncbi:MAG: hypothetical protein ACJ754_20620 [Pyrinomonadaceae bacterium]